MADQYWDYVVLAAPFDGVDGSTSISDLKGKTITPHGNARISTTQPKYGSGSVFFDGVGDYLSVPTTTDFGFGIGDFTVECWIYIIGGQGTDRGLTDFRSLNGGDIGTFFINTGNKLAFWYGKLLGGSGSSLTTDQWYHIALSRFSGITKCFLDGALQWSTTSVLNFGTSRPLGIGGSVATGILGSSPFNGRIDDLRITKGVARYTDDFTPLTYSYLLTNVGEITPPLHSIEAVGIITIVGTGAIAPMIESVTGDDGAIIASGEVAPPLETITASGTSQAEPATNHAGIMPNLESISGYGYTSVVGFGNIVSKRRGTISGSGISGEWIGNGQIIPRLESVSASGGTLVVGRASINSKKCIVNGAGSSAIAGAGMIAGRVSIIYGTGILGIVGSAQIQSHKDMISGAGTSFISGSASIMPPKEKISASRYEKPNQINLGFFRDSVVTGNSPAPSITPLHFSR